MALNPLGPVASRFFSDNSRAAVILGPVGCLVGDTEYLSPSGWRRIDEYDGGLVAQWRDGELEFVKPLEHIHGPRAPMWRFSTNHSLSMVVTENHRVPVYDWKGAFCVKSAAQLIAKPSVHRVPTNFRKTEGLRISEAQIRLRAMVAADGHYPSRGNQCVVTVRKERKKERCRWLLKTCGIEFTERYSPGRPTEARFTFERPKFAKALGREWFRASSEELAVLLDEVSYWDGLHNHAESRFSTTKKIEADIVQFAAHANGLRASISAIEYPGKAWRTGYNVHICRGSKARVAIRSETRIDPAGEHEQFCFSVPSTFFLARHNGCVFVTGNSGKTTAAAYRLARHAYEQRPYSLNGGPPTAYTRFAIVRNTGPQLRDTTINSWKKLFPENQYGDFKVTDKSQHWKFRPKGYDYNIDAEFIFRALDDEDDVKNLLSLEVTGFWFNEIREINTKILAHAGRRAGRYPGGDLGGCTWRGWIGDTNPWPFTSEYHDMFVANLREGYAYFKQPGGMDPDAENLENLEQTPETLVLPYNDSKRREQGRTYYINALQDFTKEEADMYVHCKYGASRAGQPCYPTYNDNTHCKIVAYDPKLPLLIGYDNTGRNPAAIVAQKSINGQWFLLFEYVEQNMGLEQHARNLRRLLHDEFPNHKIEKITCDPAGRAKDARDVDSRQIIAGVFNGVTVLNARTNEMTTRLKAVEDVLGRLVNGEPALLLSPKCKVLRAACISEYHFRKLKVAGAERFAEEPNKTHPHGDIAEALQYLLLGGGEGKAIVGHGTDALALPNAPAIRTQVNTWNPFSV